MSEMWAMLGAVGGGLAAFFGVLFGRRSSREATDLQRVKILLDEYSDNITELKRDVSAVKDEMREMRANHARERLEWDRRIHALRAYVSQLLNFITAMGGTPPPEPREPLD